MTHAEFNAYRRSFLKHGIRGLGAVSLLGAVPVRGALLAGEMPRVGEDDPIAVSLNYVQDVAAAKAGNLPPRAGDQRCVNCMQYKGKPESRWGGCNLFPGKQVSASGWCVAWVGL